MFAFVAWLGASGVTQCEFRAIWVFRLCLLVGCDRTFLGGLVMVGLGWILVFWVLVWVWWFGDGVRWLVLGVNLWV